MTQWGVPAGQITPQNLDAAIQQYDNNVDTYSDYVDRVNTGTRDYFSQLASDPNAGYSAADLRAHITKALQRTPDGQTRDPVGYTDPNASSFVQGLYLSNTPITDQLTQAALSADLTVDQARGEATVRRQAQQQGILDTATALSHNGVHVTVNNDGSVTITGPNAAAVATAKQQFTQQVGQNITNDYYQKDKNYQEKYYEAMVAAGQNTTMLPGETKGDYLTRVRNAANKIVAGQSVTEATQPSATDLWKARMSSKLGRGDNTGQQSSAQADWQQEVNVQAVADSRAVDNATDPSVKRTTYSDRTSVQCVRDGGSAAECGKVRSDLMNIPLSKYQPSSGNSNNNSGSNNNNSGSNDQAHHQKTSTNTNPPSSAQAHGTLKADGSNDPTRTDQAHHQAPQTSTPSGAPSGNSAHSPAPNPKPSVTSSTTPAQMATIQHDVNTRIQESANGQGVGANGPGGGNW